MIDKNHEIYKHKHICLVGDHYNPLAIIRSLGEEGIQPIVVLCNPNPYLVPNSKYIGELHIFPTIEEGYEFIINNYSNELPKPFIYNGSDDISLFLDNHYEELKDNFYFTNGAGGLCKYLNKYNITKLAEECGLVIPKEELLETGQMPSLLKYPSGNYFATKWK